MKKTIPIHLILLALTLVYPYNGMPLGELLSGGFFCTIEFVAVFLILSKEKLNFQYLPRYTAVLGIFTFFYAFNIFEEMLFVNHLPDGIIHIYLRIMIGFLSWGAGIYSSIRVMAGNNAACRKPAVLLIAFFIGFISTAATGTLTYYSIKHTQFIPPFPADNSLSGFIGVMSGSRFYSPYYWTREELLPLTTFYVLTLLMVKMSALPNENVKPSQ